MILADSCHLITRSPGREEGASSLKIVDDFMATRLKQMLDSQIVTFKLKELPVNREGCAIHQWNYGPWWSCRVEDGDKKGQKKGVKKEKL